MSESYARRGYAERGTAERGYTERGYGRGGYTKGSDKSTRTGGLIVAAVSVLSTFLVLWGLYYATGVGPRHQRALAAAQCEPNLLSVNVECTTVPVLNGQYNGIANPAIQQVNADVALYTTSETVNLTAAETALSAEVTVEKGFVHSLVSFPFPPSVAPKAEALIRAISAQAKLTAEQARSSSLAQMQSFNSQISAASAVVRTDLTLVHTTLEKPVTPNMEP
jgi:hypothetical protein